MTSKKTVIIGIVLLVMAAWWIRAAGRGLRSAPVKVGILHSLTGTMAISERSVVDATLLAIEEINEKGGLLGRRIEPVVADGRSDWAVFAREAERLIVQEKVRVVFGCWTSASRKRVKPIFEKYNHILFYPVQYEGLERSPNIVYTGAAPNQQIIPAVKWCFDHLGKRFFLVASDYVFPRAANEIIRDQAAALGAEIVGEAYLLLGSRDVAGVIQKIVETRPHVILNTITGDTNGAFFRELRRAGISSAMIPTLSFSITESELQVLGARDMVGDYACWSYFQSLESEENKGVVTRFQERYGRSRVMGDPMEAGYFGVYLWGRAVIDANTFAPQKVMKSLKDQSFRAPQGMVYIDGDTNHTWKTVRIGQIRPDGQFDIPWTSDKPIPPVPYPVHRPIARWHVFLEALYTAWAGHWENPGLLMEIISQRAARAFGLLDSLKDHGVIVSAVNVSNERNLDLTHDEIVRRNYEWQALSGDHRLADRILYNEAADVLRRFKHKNPQFAEVFVTDRFGLNVAMTDKTSDYYQADEAWWTETVRRGEPFYGEVEFDRSSNVWGVTVSVPIFGQGGRITGVVKAFININELLSPGAKKIEAVGKIEPH